MFKKFKSLVLALSLVLLILPQGQAYADQKTLDIYKFRDGLTYALDGESFFGDSFVKDSVTYMQLRNIGEVLGIDFDWLASEKRVSFEAGGGLVRLYIGSRTAYVGQEKVAISNPPIARDGKTFLPVRFISELLGLEVNFENGKSMEDEGRALLFSHFPGWKAEEAKGRYKFNDGHARFKMEVTGYYPNDGEISFHVYDLIEYPEESHTATRGWYLINLHTNQVYDLVMEEFL